MIKAPIDLHDLRRRIYVKAKAEPHWRFWGLYVHVCKIETLRVAYTLAKNHNGAPGIDGVTFEAIEEAGLDAFLQALRDELVSRTYRPMRCRRKEIPKDGGKVRVLSIPTIRDRVVQGALKLICGVSPARRVTRVGGQKRPPPSVAPAQALRRWHARWPAARQARGQGHGHDRSGPGHGGGGATLTAPWG